MEALLSTVKDSRVISGSFLLRTTGGTCRIVHANTNVKHIQAPAPPPPNTHQQAGRTGTAVTRLLAANRISLIHAVAAPLCSVSTKCSTQVNEEVSSATLTASVDQRHGSHMCDLGRPATPRPAACEVPLASRPASSVCKFHLLFHSVCGHAQCCRRICDAIALRLLSAG